MNEGKHRTCKVYKDGILVTAGNITKCCEYLGNRNWQSSISQKLAKGQNVIEHHGYQFIIDSLVVKEKGPDPRRVRSYNAALELCNKNNVTPLFTFDEWHGQVSGRVGAPAYRYYTVRCNQCNNPYEAYFKLVSDRMSKCPNCFDGHRNQDISYNSALKELEQNKLTPLFTREDFVGKNSLYKVKCNVCGLEFQTRLLRNHFNNCPYCHESSSSYNQIPKIKKHCEDNHLTLLDENYKPGTFNGHPSYIVKCNICGTTFKAKFVGKQVTNCPKCCAHKQRSNRERMMCYLLDQSNINHYSNYRQHGISLPGSHNPLELDIYIPGKRIAFEFNGQIYHNCSLDTVYKKSKSYHKTKTELFLSKGIKVYHIWDFVSDQLCSSIILAKLGLANRIFARQCTVQGVDSETAKEFFDKYHVDGNVRSNKVFGLYKGSTLLACLSIMHRHLQASNDNHWEIGRFATIYSTVVVGGYSKLLKYAISYLKSQGINQLVSYCNRDLSPDYKDTFYYKYGFNFEGDSGIIYWYYATRDELNNVLNIKRGEKYARQKFQKHKLIDIYNELGYSIPSDATEQSLAEGLGLVQCCNSGNWKFSLDLSYNKA